MAVLVKIGNSESFLDDMKVLISFGDISEWVLDDDGDFTLSEGRQRKEAWFHPYLLNEETLVFGIIGRKNVSMTFDTYSTYHGEFVRMLLLNYGGQIDKISIIPPFSNNFDTKSIER